jgi:putative membrane protein
MTARFDAEALPRSPREEAFDPTSIVRPARVLLWYYVTIALLTGPLFPFVFLPLLFKYETLRYRFDASGLSMSWGLLFRKEVFLTYRRIQDIHLTRHAVAGQYGRGRLGAD